jgi:penicillin-binding protein 1A
MSVGDREAVVRFGEYQAPVKPSDAPWWRSLKQLVKPGDLTVFRLNKIHRDTQQVEATLVQLPAVQGALVAVEVPSGEIKAMVGGYDFNTSKFNHATQGNRQTGSAFKPFIYAAAVEYGLTPDDVVLDTPFSKGGYEPHNYDVTFKGPISIAQAVAQSRNVPAVRVLEEIGIARATRMVERLGLPNPMAPYLSSALGATEEPLIDMVKAYAVFAGVGQRVHPHFIRRVVNWDGAELGRWEPPEPERVLSPYVASTMVRLMQGAVNGGTAASIRGHPEFSRWDIGGKTGTVNDFTDAWFIGYTPTLCAGVWIGFDEKRPLGNKETGAVGALPIWIEFMKTAVKGQEPQRFRLVTQPSAEVATLQAQRRRERVTWVEGSDGQLLPIMNNGPALDPLAQPDLTAGESSRDPALKKILPAEAAAPAVSSPPAASPSQPKHRRRRVGTNNHD